MNSTFSQLLIITDHLECSIESTKSIATIFFDYTFYLLSCSSLQTKTIHHILEILVHMAVNAEAGKEYGTIIMAMDAQLLLLVASSQSIFPNTTSISYKMLGGLYSCQVYNDVLSVFLFYFQQTQIQTMVFIGHSWMLRIEIAYIINVILFPKSEGSPKHCLTRFHWS